MKRILVLTRQPESYSARRLCEAATDRKIQLELVDPHEFYIYLTGARPGVELPKRRLGLRHCAVIPRLGSLATEYSLTALDLLERAGARPLNGYASLLKLRHKFNALAQLAGGGVPIPDSVMLHAPSEVAPAVKRLGGYPVVLKFIRGSQGVGVVFAPDESVVASVLEALNLVQYDVLLQRYYPAGASRDVRVFVLGGKARWAVTREAEAGHFRANFHRGGKAERCELDRRLRRLATRASAVFKLGLAGVDLIEGDDGPLVLEVNGSPGFEAIEQAHEADVAGEILSYTAKNVV